LKNLFPELFAIACGKDSWVEENMQKKNGNILWNIYVLNLCMIGRWKWSPDFLRFCILLKEGMKERIKFVGSLREGNHLKYLKN